MPAAHGGPWGAARGEFSFLCEGHGALEWVRPETTKASRKQSSLSGKESAQGCIPQGLLGRPDEALGGGMERGPGIALQAMQEKKALSSRGRGRLRGFLELRRTWAFSPEARRGSQGASRAAPGKSGLHAQTWAPSHHPLMNSPSSSLPCSSADPTLEVSTGSFHPCLWRPASSCLKMLSGPRWVCDSYMGRF